MAELRLEVFRDGDPEDLCGWQLRIIVDGADLTAAGCGMDPDWLLPERLQTTGQPHREVLVRCGCSVEGCGSASTVIARDSERVTWTSWESSLGRFDDIRFEAGDYDAEVRRAHEDRSWEPDARRLAREARAYLTPDIVAALAAQGLENPDIKGMDAGTIEVWFDAGDWDSRHWQIWLDVTGTAAPDIATLLLTPPATWSKVTWFPNTRSAMSPPPPMAGLAWRKSEHPF